MDDIRIVCKDKYEARKALKLLICELRKKGLNVNSKKTQIFDLNNPDQKGKAHDLLQENDPKIDQIQNLLQSKKARAVQIAVPMLRKKTIDLMESDGTQKRHFRFCINRLESLSKIPEIKPLLQLDDITDFIITELISQPWSTDTFSRYLISVELNPGQLEKIQDIIADHSKNIYEWQEYHLWKVIISHKHQHPDLILKARENLTKRSNDSPVIAGSALYLCALGDANDKKHIVDNFKHFKDHIIQRAALIGIKDLSYDSFIKPSVEKFILPCIKGCYKNLKTYHKNEFINKQPSLNYRNFCDEVPEFIS